MSLGNFPEALDDCFKICINLLFSKLLLQQMIAFKICINVLFSKLFVNQRVYRDSRTATLKATPGAH